MSPAAEPRQLHETTMDRKHDFPIKENECLQTRVAIKDDSLVPQGSTDWSNIPVYELKTVLSGWGRGFC